MTRWSRDPYLLVLACIGAALVVFVLGVSVVLAAGHSVPAGLWAVGGAAIGILAGVLLPRSGSAEFGETEGEGEGDAEASAGDGVAAPPRSTPPALVVVLALVAFVGLMLSVLFYAVQTRPLLDLADALIFVASLAGGALLGIHVPQPEPPPALVEPPPGLPSPPGGPTPNPPPTQPKRPEPPPKPDGPALSLRAVLAAVAILVVLGAVALLFSLLPRATVQGAQIFHVVSLFLIAATVGLAVAAFTGSTEKRQGLRQGLAAGAVLTAVLAFVSSTASGLVVDRLTSHPTSSGLAVAVKAYLTSPAAKNYFSAKVAAPKVKVELGSECTVYLVHLDELVDDEPHIAAHLPGKSFPLDQGAQACHLKRASEVDALAAVLAAR